MSAQRAVAKRGNHLRNSINYESSGIRLSQKLEGSSVSRSRGDRPAIKLSKKTHFVEDNDSGDFSAALGGGKMSSNVKRRLQGFRAYGQNQQIEKPKIIKAHDSKIIRTNSRHQRHVSGASYQDYTPSIDNSGGQEMQGVSSGKSIIINGIEHNIVEFPA